MKPEWAVQKGEYGDFFEKYISLVRDENIPSLLLSQIETIRLYFRGITEEKAITSYAADKWSYKEVLGHITDTEKIIYFRALCIARGEKKPLFGFDQDEYVSNAGFNDVPLANLLEDFELNRYSLVSFVKSLSENRLRALGNANGYDISVRALLYIIPGHFEHHMRLFRERY